MIYLLFLFILSNPNSVERVDVYDYLMESSWQISELIYPAEYKWATETIRPCEKDDRIRFGVDGYCYQHSGEMICYPGQEAESQLGSWVLERNQKFLVLHEKDGLSNRYTILAAADDQLHLALRVDIGQIEFIYKRVEEDVKGTNQEIVER